MEQKGNLLIRDLWQNVIYSVNDMRFVNTDANYHQAKAPEECLKEEELEALVETLSGEPVQDARRLQRATKMGTWLIVQPSTVNGTEIGEQEWLDALFLWYGLDPPDLPK